jgi:hypothetical protein
VPLRFLADEDFDNDLLRGVQRQVPWVDFTRVQDEELSGEPDPTILEWAAKHDHVVLSHDVNTMTRHTYARIRAGQRVPGVCIVPQSLPIGQAIEELILLIECSRPEDWENQVRYLPL